MHPRVAGALQPPPGSAHRPLRRPHRDRRLSRADAAPMRRQRARRDELGRRRSRTVLAARRARPRQAAGRQPQELTVITVTKTFPASDVAAAARAGRPGHRREPGAGARVESQPSWQAAAAAAADPLALHRPAAAQQGGAGRPRVHGAAHPRPRRRSSRRCSGPPSARAGSSTSSFSSAWTATRSAAGSPKPGSRRSPTPSRQRAGAAARRAHGRAAARRRAAAGLRPAARRQRAAAGDRIPTRRRCRPGCRPILKMP